MLRQFSFLIKLMTYLLKIIEMPQVLIMACLLWYNNKIDFQQSLLLFQQQCRLLLSLSLAWLVCSVKLFQNSILLSAMQQLLGYAIDKLFAIESEMQAKFHSKQLDTNHEITEGFKYIQDIFTFENVLAKYLKLKLPLTCRISNQLKIINQINKHQYSHRKIQLSQELDRKRQYNMPEPFQLDYKFQINAPLNGVLRKKVTEVKFSKQIIFVAKRILKFKLKAIFKMIKNHSYKSPDSLMLALLLSMKQSKKQIKQSYLPYHVPQINFNQPQVPKTPIFNSRVRNIRINAFLQLKSFFFSVKSLQVKTILENRQNQLLNHVIPKIQQKIYTYGFRKILEYSKQQKGRNKIVRQLDKLYKNITKRVFYCDFFNRIKSYKLKQGKKSTAIKKLNKVVKNNLKFNLFVAFRKIQIFQQYLSLGRNLADKKQRISKIYDLNAQRTTILQKQRQMLRNLKHAIDHEAVQKNIVLADKKRSLMTAKTKFNEQSKQFNDQLVSVQADVFKLQNIFLKQSYILEKLQSNRKYIRQVKRKGVDFEMMTIMMYKTISDSLNQDDVNTIIQLVKIQQHRNEELEDVPLFDNIVKSREYKCRSILLLQRIVKLHQKKQSQSLNGSMMRPSAQSLSFQVKASQSVAIFKSSKVQGNSNVFLNRLKNIDTPELMGLKQEYSLLIGLITLIINKSFQIKIKKAITAQIQQLSQFLASDLQQE